MHFLLLCGRAPTLSNAIRPYPKPWKNFKTWKNAFFAGFREGPNAIQRYPSLSQTLEKLQNLEKTFFAVLREVAKLWKNCKTWKNAFFAALRRAPTLSNATRPYPKPWKNCKTWKNAFFAILREVAKPWKNCKTCKMHFFWFPGRPHPTLSVLISDPRKICKTWKKHFLLFCGRSQNFGKIAKPGKMHFLLLCGGPQRYPTLPVLIPNPGKIAKPGKMHFLLFCGRSKDLGKIAKPGKMHFSCLREGPNAIQRHPSWSQTLEKLQKPGKMHFSRERLSAGFFQ